MWGGAQEEVLDEVPEGRVLVTFYILLRVCAKKCVSLQSRFLRNN